MATIVETESISKDSESSSTVTTSSSCSTPQPPPSSSSSPQQRRLQRHQQQSFPPFSIRTMVEHFRQLIEECWKLESYHLLGHSWGGILAYEYLKMKEQQQQHQQLGCRSLILASAPTSAQVIQKECKILMSRLQNGDNADPTTDNNNTTDESNADNDDDENNGDVDTLVQSSEQVFSEEFHQTHECRLPTIPLALMDAMAQAGPTPWRGIHAIRHYTATLPNVVESPTTTSSDNNDIESAIQQSQESKEIRKIKVPTMLLRGEYDFCTEKCMVGWVDLITVESSDSSSSSSSSSTCSSSSDTHSNIKALKNCSHYAMLEDERQFGKVVSDFLQLRDQQVGDKKGK